MEAVSWFEHDGVGRFPLPKLPGFGPAASDDPRYHVPCIGEHSRQVLQALDYSDEAVRQFVDHGAVGCR